MKIRTQVLMAAILSAFLVSSAVAMNNHDDISFMNLGARQTAMGNAYTAVSDDLMSVFYNPAGLTNVRRMQAHIQNTQAIGEINQTVLGAAIPFGSNIGLGIGYVSNSLGDVWIGATPASLTTGTYGSQVLLLGVGINFDPQRQNDFFKGLSLGVTFKNFSESATGASAFAGNGWDVDLGLRANLTHDLVLGLAAKNMIGSDGRSVMGSFSYANGTIENIISSYHAGLSYFLYQNQLILSSEVVVFESGYYPSLWRFGGEWRWQQWLSLRAAYSQSPRPASNINPNQSGDGHFSLGVGLIQGDFSFDYAYNPGYSTVDTSQHFISLTYGNGVAESTINIKSQTKAIATQNISQILEPKPYAVYYQNQILIKGYSEDATSIMINGVQYPLKLKSDFSIPFQLSMGRNQIQIEVGMERVTRPVLRLAHVNELQQYGLQDDLAFLMTLSPEERDSLYNRPLTYDELAHLIVMLKEIKIPNTLSNAFSDTDLMFVKGYYDENNRGVGTVTRQSMAQILARMEGARDFSDGQASLQFLMSSRKFRANDFYPLNEGLTVSDALDLLSKTSAGEQKLKMLLEGFSVPLLSRGDATLQGGSQQSIFIKFPPDAHTAELSAEVFSQKVILTKLNTRYWSGLVTVPDTAPYGTIPFVLKVKDEFGNLLNYDLQLGVAQRTQSAPYPYNAEATLPSDVPIFVKLNPPVIPQGGSAQLVVGHSEGLKAISVQGVLDRKYSVALIATDPNIWMGQVYVPTNMPPGYHNLQIMVQDNTGMTRVKNIAFEVTTGSGYSAPIQQNYNQTTQPTDQNYVPVYTRPLPSNNQPTQYVYAPDQYALTSRPNENVQKQTVGPDGVLNSTQAQVLVPETPKPYNYDSLSTGEVFLMKVNPRKVEQDSELTVSIGFPQGGHVKKSTITFSPQKKFDMKQVSDILHTSEFYISKKFPVGHYKMDIEIVEGNDKVIKREVLYEVVPATVKKIPVTPKNQIKKVTPKPVTKQTKQSQVSYAPETVAVAPDYKAPEKKQTKKIQAPVPQQKTKTFFKADLEPVYMPSLYRMFNPKIQLSANKFKPGQKLYIKVASAQPLAAASIQLGANQAVNLSGYTNIFQGSIVIPANSAKGVHGLKVFMRNESNQYFFFEQEITVD